MGDELQSIMLCRWRVRLGTRRRLTLILGLVLAWGGGVLTAQTIRAEPPHLAPLASASPPKCSRNNGTREFHSATVQFGDAEALIAAISETVGSLCQRTMSLHLKRGSTESTVPLPPDLTTCEIVDAAPDHSRLLLAGYLASSSSGAPIRDQLVGILSADGADLRWKNAWDLLKLKDCAAGIYPEGFSAGGQIVVSLRQSPYDRYPSCVSTPALYEVDFKGGLSRLPDTTQLKNYAAVIRPESQACASDPDLVGPCFTVHGRLSFWNGNPTIRISWIGTNRILGVPNDVLPGEMRAHLNWDLDAYGDYTVCPLTVQKPGAMQMVCIESAQKVAYKSR